MARNRYKGNRIGGPFLALPRDVIDHPAFLRLSAYAKALLIDLGAQVSSRFATKAMCLRLGENVSVFPSIRPGLGTETMRLDGATRIALARPRPSQSAVTSLIGISVMRPVFFTISSLGRVVGAAANSLAFIELSVPNSAVRILYQRAPPPRNIPTSGGRG